MNGWLSNWTEALWRNGLALIPLALAIVIVTRWVRCRPATRHTLWLMALLWLLMPPMLPSLSLPAQTSNEIATPAPTIVPTRTQPPLHTSTIKKHEDMLRVESVPSTFSPMRGRSEGVLTNNATEVREPVNATRSDIKPPRRNAIVLTEAKPTNESPSDLVNALPDVAGATAPLWIALAARVDWTPLLHVLESVMRGYALVPEELAGILDVPASLAVRHAQPAGRRSAAPVASHPRTSTMAHRHSSIERASKSAGGVVPTCQAASAPARHALEWPEPVATNEPAVRTPRQSPMSVQPSYELAELVEEIDLPPFGASSTMWPRFVSTAADQCVAWVAALMRVRDALGSLPALPVGVWLGGILVVAVFGLARLVLFRLRIRSARRADVAVVRFVSDAAAHMGLRRAPDVWIGDGRFSPMIWCGLRTRLVLPGALWTELDDVGRRAVIFHELAHIRRRDHRVIWIELAVGCLYWWHPVVWFVRRQLHAEAENCCDAWVTTLLPRMRRGYAHALLRTREYIATDRRAMPGLGIGITTPRAKRLARRLTMVMTESTRPRLTATGFLLALAMAGIGWVAAPAQSCPPDEKATAAKGCAHAAAAVEAAPAAKTSFEQYLEGKTVAPGEVRAMLVGDRREARERMEALERRLEELTEELERMEEALEDDDEVDEEDEEDADDDDDDDDDEDDDEEEARHVHRHRNVHQHTPVRAPRAPRAPIAPVAPIAPCPPCPPPTPGVFAPGIFAPGPNWGDLSHGEKVWKGYSLSDGKLKDFTELMSRSDVPILIRSRGKKIEIQATESQHAIFNAFFQLIDPSDERAEATPPGLFNFGFNYAFGGGHGSGCCSGQSDCPLCRKATEFKAKAEAFQSRAREEVDQLRARFSGEADRVRAGAMRQAEEVRQRIRSHSRLARTEARAQEDMIRSLERQAERMHRQAEQMRDRSERLRERAESLRERAGDLSGQVPQETIDQHIRALEDSLRQLTDQAGALDAQAELLNQQGDLVRHQIEGLNEHAELLDQRAETIDDAARMLEEDDDVAPELAAALVALAGDVEKYTSPAILDALKSAESMIDSVAMQAGEHAAYISDEIAEQVSAEVARAWEEAQAEEALSNDIDTNDENEEDAAWNWDGDDDDDNDDDGDDD